jgi:transcriptional regulator with XRE-family HTH domain
MSIIDKQKIAKAIKVFRGKMKLTKKEMARRIKISPSHYGNLEAGRNSPSYSVVVSFMDIGLDLIKFVGKGTTNDKSRKTS